METASTEYGDLYIPPWDNFIGASLKEYGYYCNVEQKFHHQMCGLLNKTIEEPGIILDIGAHIGSMSVTMGHGSSATTPWRHSILAVEPQPNNYAVLCANLARNNMLFNPVIPVHGAIIPAMEVSHATPLATIPYLDATKPFNSGAVPLSQWEDMTDEVGVAYTYAYKYTLSDLISSLDMSDRDVLYMKADIEGTEASIIEDLVTRNGRTGLDPVMFVECNTPESLDAIKPIVDDLAEDYKVHWMAEPYYMSSFDKKNIWNREIWSINLMCFPEWFINKYNFETDAPRFEDASDMEEVVALTKKVVRNV